MFCDAKRLLLAPSGRQKSIRLGSYLVADKRTKGKKEGERLIKSVYR
jgi:hypothetical protein